MKKQRWLLFPLAIAAVLSPLFLITNLVLHRFYKIVYNGRLGRWLQDESVLTYFFVGSGTFTFAAYKSAHSPPFLQSYIFNYVYWAIVVWWSGG